MEGSRRNRRDGQTFIGGVEMDGDNYLNDFVIP